MEIYKDFTFEAAHRLEHLPPEHKCHHLHGHSYRVRIVVDGEIDSETGWVMDFADIKRAMAPILDQLDHKYLNDIEGLQPSTTEMVARWIWKQLKPALPILARLEVSETPTSGCIYRGEAG